MKLPSLLQTFWGKRGSEYVRVTGGLKEVVPTLQSLRFLFVEKRAAQSGRKKEESSKGGRAIENGTIHSLRFRCFEKFVMECDFFSLFDPKKEEGSQRGGINVQQIAVTVPSLPIPRFLRYLTSKF